MFISYLKIALRNMRRFKGYSLINIAGLAVGMACCILIMLWVQDELAYDKFHEKGDRIHLLCTSQQLQTGEQIIPCQPAPLGQYLQDQIPDIEEYTRLFHYTRTLQVGDMTQEQSVTFADPALFSMFTFPLLVGDPATVFTDPSSVVITGEVARRYFGDQNPIGQTVTIDQQNDVTVTGILQDYPPNSVISAEIIFPFQFLGIQGYNIDEWAGSDFYTFLLLKDGASVAAVVDKIQSLTDDLVKQRYGKEDNPYRMFAHPLERLHLYNMGSAGGPIQTVYILSMAALFILLIASINFINLSTARSTRRAKEIGLRKVLGANRASLISQILSESICLALISFGLALMLVEILLPHFNHLTQKSLAIDLGNAWVLGGILVIGLFAGLFSGSLPAFYISRFLPVTSLKGHLKSGRGGFMLRRTLVVVQFTLSLVLILSTLVIGSQIRYLNHKDLGLNRENVAFFWASSGIKNHYHAFKNDLLQHHSIKQVTGSAQNIWHVNSTIGNNWSFDGRNPDQRIELHFDWVSADYAQTFEIQMAAGRFYSPVEFPADTVDGIVLNESAVNLMGISDPIGKRFSYWGNDCRIIGIIKDFHLEPLYETLKPMILIYNNFNSIVYLRLDGDDIPGSLAYVEEVFRKYEPGGTLDLRFLDATYERVYRSEGRLQTIFNWFASFAIFTACLGLLGLVSFITEQRTREIGIRKVLGATVGGIVTMISREFVLLVILAGGVAAPLAWYFTNQWLGNFAYRIDLSVWYFLAAGIGALLAAFLTVSYQTIKAALADPVKSLRYE